MTDGTRKIFAASVEAKDPHEMDGWEKLRRIREIMQAEKPKDELDPNERIRICYEMATHRPGELDGFEKIRRCAGRTSREEEELAKSMTAMEGLDRLLHTPRQPKPRRPSALQRFMASHTWEGAPPWAWCPPGPAIPPPATPHALPAPIPPLPPPPMPFDCPWGFFEFRDRLARDLQGGIVAGRIETMIDHAHDRYGLTKADAAEWVEKFMHDILRHGECRAWLAKPAGPSR